MTEHKWLGQSPLVKQRTGTENKTVKNIRTEKGYD